MADHLGWLKGKPGKKAEKTRDSTTDANAPPMHPSQLTAKR